MIPGTRTLLLLTMSLILSTVLGTHTAHAVGPLLVSDSMDRSSAVTAFWCPDDVNGNALEFTANGQEATIRFTGLTHGVSFGSWLKNRIDNVAVLEKSVYDNFINPVDTYNFFCFLINPGTPRDLFFFQDVPAPSFALLDKFDAGPDAGWDLSDGAYWVPPGMGGTGGTQDGRESAPNDLNVGDDVVAIPTGGSLGLGAENDAPGFATTEITVGGLTKGAQYVLSFWWRCNNDLDMNGFTQPPPDLVVEIFGTDPIIATESASWGGVKALFKQGP